MGINSNDNYGELLVMIIMGITSNDNYGITSNDNYGNY